MSKFDNIETINRLTHSKNGLVNYKLFLKLIDNFHEYIMFRKIIKKKDVIIQCAETEDDSLKFIICIKNKKAREEFISNYKEEHIEYRKEQYLIKISEVNKDKVSIRFKKEV